MAEKLKPFVPPESYYEEKKDNFPDLSSYSTHMSNVLTPEMYNRLRDKRTSNGYTLDMAIQTGEGCVQFTSM